jgi:hypothetical protein
MATKLFENISSVQNIPAATSDTPRDRYKPISLYLVGAGTGEWKVTVSYSPINSSVYKKLGPVFTLSVSNTNPFQLFSWDYDCDSFVAWVSEIKGNATATLWMTQGNARNLDYLLMTEPSARLKADPTDIPNCSLEYTPDGWVGNMGVFSTYGALLANPTNALVPGKVWAIVASASSFAKYNYMSAGWVLESSVGATGASNLPGSPSAPFTTVGERTAWATANLASLLPGRTTAWGPGNVEYLWNGPLATDWAAVNSANPSISGSVAPWDLIVYGATPGGIMAAVAARLAGAGSVAIVEPSSHFGGMLTGGLASADINPTASTALIVGMANDFYADVASFYGRTHIAFFRDNVYHADQWAIGSLLRKWIAKAGVQVFLGSQLISVQKSGTKITRADFSNFGTAYAKQYIDASYPGDMLPLAGVTYSLGRESSATYGESYAGIYTQAERQFPNPGVDPYVIPGDAGSGLLPGMMSVAYGTLGAADPNVQAFTYRFTLSKRADRIAIPEPDNYNPLDYELLGRAAVIDAANLTSAASLLIISQYADSKYDINDHYCVSTNYIKPHSTDPTKSIATEYVEATYSRRQEIEYEAKQWILGLLKFIKTDSRIPVAVRNDMATYGFPFDEWGNSGNFPPGGGFYIREGRRLVGDFVLKQGDVTAANTYGDPIAYVYYPLDSHTVRRVVVAGKATNEGSMYNGGFTGAKITLRVLFPKIAECTNLQCVFGASASRVAFTSIRMEPIQMAMGEAAGVVAALAIQMGVPVQKVPYSMVQRKLRGFRYLENGPSILSIDETTHRDGIIETSGTWGVGSAPAYGCPLVHAASSAAGAYKRFHPGIKKSGPHKISICYPAATASTRGTKTPINIVSAEGTLNLVVNQNWATGGDSGDWNELGTFNLRVGYQSVKFAFSTLPSAGNNFVVTINGVSAPSVPYATSVAATFAAIKTAVETNIAGVFVSYDSTNLTCYSYTTDILTGTCVVTGGPANAPDVYLLPGPSEHYLEVATVTGQSSVIAGVRFEPLP